MYPIKEDMIVVPITKRMEIILNIQVCLISQMNINYKENGEKKSFSWKPKALISCILGIQDMIMVPITKRMEFILGIQVYLISQMNFDYKENGENKSFSCESKASILSIPMRRTWL